MLEEHITDAIQISESEGEGVNPDHAAKERIFL